MKRSKKGFFAVILAAAVFMMGAFAGCGKKEEKHAPIEQDKYLFGMGEMPSEFGGATDSKITMQMVADLSGALGAKSFRIWMHLTSLVERDAETNEVRLKPEPTARYHQFIDALKAQGITHLTAMSHYYLYPVGYSPSAGSVIPNPEDEFDDYVQFMNILRSCYKLLAEEFPEVQYWEPGNETNGSDGRFVAKNGYNDASGADNSLYIYSSDDLAYITADMCWYANAGIEDAKKEGKAHPNAMTVLPGMIFNMNGATASFLQKIYDWIGSGYLPSDPTVKYADIDEDNYFQVLNWHPYAFGLNSYDSWVKANQDVYEVAKKNGDKGKKVFLTELGWTDQGSEDVQNTVAEAFPEVIDIIKKDMPWVETFHTFRMFDWETCPLAADSIERFFGLFSSPNNDRGATPKPVALSLFKYFNGENADASALYKYAKAQ